MIDDISMPSIDRSLMQIIYQSYGYIQKLKEETMLQSRGERTSLPYRLGVVVVPNDVESYRNSVFGDIKHDLKLMGTCS